MCAAPPPRLHAHVRPAVWLRAGARTSAGLVPARGGRQHSMLGAPLAAASQPPPPPGTPLARTLCAAQVEALQLLADVAAGMAYLHACSVVHGDLKAENVLLASVPDRPQGLAAKVTDFGLARLLTVRRLAAQALRRGILKAQFTPRGVPGFVARGVAGQERGTKERAARWELWGRRRRTVLPLCALRSTLSGATPRRPNTRAAVAARPGRSTRPTAARARSAP